MKYRLLTAAPGTFGTYAEVGKELADKLVTAHTVDPAAARDALLHTMACKAAIKGGWKSDLSELRVLVDRVVPEEGFAEGRSFREAPEVDGLIEIRNIRKDIKEGDMINVKITEAMTHDMAGEEVL